ncbi:hypothetical protein SAMN05216338_106315 [Bradyrhizobium sp. Rc2d]|uniref:hypothetical protein n=1 Tax=Bradyrhizobium sp. Rc2d TaxID=1855321 RepID=UPI000885664E|nr:hypothetical protein [Bradyrhizobium sp. Rc2d]SDJ74207.1 hypothetical protein SAMN05216338_106315 [Bradyrhizobium sp. Rc2d]
MVKDSKTRPPGSGGFPKRKPAPAEPPDGKGNRLTLRMHPDIMEILSARAVERGVSRSHLVEQILVGFMRADPRNPKMDAVGRIVDSAESPLALRERAPLQVAEKWQKFVTAHGIVMGSPPPQDWLDDADTYWDAPSHDARGPQTEEDIHERAQRGRWSRRRQRLD